MKQETIYGFKKEEVEKTEQGYFVKDNGLYKECPEMPNGERLVTNNRSKHTGLWDSIKGKINPEDDMKNWTMNGTEWAWW